MARTATSRGVTARALLVAAVVASALAGLPAVAPAAEVSVGIRDNLFTPQQLRIDPGDTVTWTNGGTRVHDVTSDTGEFLSGDLGRGASFSHRFEEEGYFYYHCSFHGRAGRQGMWGVVIVGDPPPPHGGDGDEHERPKIEVPGDFETIQAAVDAAEPGSTIVVAPGTYPGGVRIATDDLVLKGVDRFRTVLDGGDTRPNGVVVAGARAVTVANLTVRDFTNDGILFQDARRYTVDRVDAVGNGGHGVYSLRSYDGVVRRSYGWGSGAAAFAIAECMGCGALFEDVYASMSYVGYSGTNATGVTVRDSKWVRNGAGIVTSTDPSGNLGPGRGTLVVGNVVRDNDYANAPAFPATMGVPLGTGVWLAGVQNNVVRDNEVTGHDRFGVLVSESGAEPVGNTVRRNRLDGAAEHVLAWDGTGSDNCFEDNSFTGETGPPEIETLYACARRPFDGTPYAPVQDAVAAGIAESEARVPEEPRDPSRPRCQKGRPGCHRH